MFDSIDDWLIILLVAGVLFWGSSKIPQFAHSLGRATGEFKKGRMEVDKEIADSKARDAATKSQS